MLKENLDTTFWPLLRYSNKKNMKLYFLISCLLLSTSFLAQIDLGQIDIYRDKYGVPHIYGNTDKAAAYGLAWAHAEDDFETIQYTFLPSKGLMGMHTGKDGVIMDYLVEFLRCRKTARAHVKDLSPDVLKVIEGYVAGINAYAKSFPDEVLVKNSFPMTVMDYLTGYNLVIHFFSDTGDILGELMSGKNKSAQEEMEEKTIFTYIQGLQEIISNFKPRTMTEKRRFALAKQQLKEVKRLARRMQNEVHVLQEKLNILEESLNENEER